MRAEYAIVQTVWFPRGLEARVLYAARTALQSWALLDPMPLVVALVDDGSPDEDVVGSLASWGMPDTGISVTRTPRWGCGGALRAGVRHVMDEGLSDVVAYFQADWLLTEPLDLAPSLALLNSGAADIVRLGPTHPNLAAHVVRTTLPGAEWCLEYDWAGGGYVVGWRPALYHRRVFERFPLDGLEGLSAIEAERRWVENMAQSDNPPRVFHAPNCTLAGPFRHIDTVELGEDSPATLTARYASTGAEAERG